jgi:hypothetical protein
MLSNCRYNLVIHLQKVNAKGRNNVLFIIVAICISFGLGLALYRWSIRYTMKIRRQEIKPNMIMKQLRPGGFWLVMFSTAFPIAYEVVQLPYLVGARLATIMLLSGLAITIVGYPSLSSKLVRQFMAFMLRSIATRSSDAVAYAVSLFIQDGGTLLAVTGIYSWIFILALKK